MIPLRVELEEPSGPVSPRFQYDLRVVVDEREASATVSAEDRGPRKFSASRALRAGETDGLRAALAADDAWRASPTVAQEGKRVGVAEATLAITLGDASARVVYRTASLRDAPWLAEIVRAIKALGEPLRPSDAP